MFLLKKWKLVSVSLLIIILTVSIAVFAAFYHTKKQVTELFKLGEKRQEENYFMAQFDYKMLGIADHIAKGNYVKGITMLNQLHDQMTTGEGLIKLPKFNNKEEELEFYLNLQNPDTGSFMDPAYPFGTFHGPTENVLLHIELLSNELGRPVKLKYPLKYLERINTPEKLTLFLNRESIVGILGAKLPQTSFHFIRDFFALARDPKCSEDRLSPITRNNLYNLSPEWRHAFLQWMYDARDPGTGLWGPKSKSGKLMKKDLNNSASILKTFVDSRGYNIYPEFTMRYNDQMFTSILEGLAEAKPDEADLHEWHNWNLKIAKSIKVMTKYLWKDASKANREKARVLLEDFLKNRFKNFYIPEEGAFCYYPNAKHAALDGVVGFYIYTWIGANSGERYQELWGLPEEHITDLGSFDIAALNQEHLDLINKKNINSIRIYTAIPDYDNLVSNVAALVYPQKPLVLDFMDIAHKYNDWLQGSPLTMGTTVSKADVLGVLKNIKFDRVETYQGNIPLNKANDLFRKHNQLTLIGFDLMQMPCFKVTFQLSNTTT